MEFRGSTKREHDESEMLIGGFPNAITEVPKSRNLSLYDPSLLHGNTSSPFSIFTESYDYARPADNRGNVVLGGGLTLRSSFDQNVECSGKLDNAHSGLETHELTVKQDLSLPDDKSLRMAFGKMSFKYGLAPNSSTKVLNSYNRATHDHNSFVDEQFCDQLNNSMLGLQPLEMSRPPMATTPMASTPNGANSTNSVFGTCSHFTSTSGTLKCGGNSSGHELRSQNPKSLLHSSMDQWQSFPSYSGAIPVNPSLHANPFLLSAHVPDIELAASTYPHQYFLDAQSPARISARYNSTPDIEWWKMEVEKYYRRDQECFYLQQLHNQELIIPQLPVNTDVAIGPLMGNPTQPHFEMPHSKTIEHGNVDSLWSIDGIQRGCNQLNVSSTCENCGIPHHQKLTSPDIPLCPGKGFCKSPMSDGVRKQDFPEKILTRLHGMNSLISLRPDSIASNQSNIFSDKKGRIVCNSHVLCSQTPVNGSFLLEDNSSNNSRLPIPALQSSKSIMNYNYIDEVAGNISSMAKDQHRCRFLQRKLTEGTMEDVAKIFAEAISEIVNLTINPFGNYLVQKLLEVCNNDQRMHILRALTKKPGDLIKLSCNMHGTRVVQKLFETLQTTEQFSMMVSALKAGAVVLMKDINGTHIAQRCLENFPPEHNEFIFDAAVAHCVEFARDRQGCCALQKCLEHSAGAQKHKLMSEISYNSLILSQDPFGNYVVQRVLEQNVPLATAIIVEQLEGNYEHLSMLKYSSNVVEKCLKHGSEEERVKIIQELINNSRLFQILDDPYGNYVIQAALRECKGYIHAALVDSIRPHVAALRSSPYGNKVLSRISIKK